MRFVGYAVISVALFILYLVVFVLVGFVWLRLVELFSGMPDTWWARNVAPYIMTTIAGALSAGLVVWAASAAFRRMPMRYVVPGFVGLLTVQWGFEAFWRLHHYTGSNTASYVQGVLAALAAIVTAISEARKADRLRGL